MTAADQIVQNIKKVLAIGAVHICGGAEGSSGSSESFLSERGLQHPILSDRKPITRPRRSRRGSGFVQSQ